MLTGQEEGRPCPFLGPPAQEDIPGERPLACSLNTVPVEASSGIQHPQNHRTSLLGFSPSSHPKQADELKDHSTLPPISVS